jgi:hypothetical protein
VSFPTGQYEQGALSPVITPHHCLGKGYKDFDVQETFGITPPTGNVPPLDAT